MKVQAVVGGADARAGAVDVQLAPLAELAGESLRGVRLWQRDLEPWGRVELLELDVGGGLPLHSGEQFILCQVIAGRGRLGLPDGSEVAFDGPHLFTFEPGTVHSWHSIEEPTRMAVWVAAS